MTGQELMQQNPLIAKMVAIRKANGGSLLNKPQAQNAQPQGIPGGAMQQGDQVNPATPDQEERKIIVNALIGELKSLQKVTMPQAQKQPQPPQPPQPSQMPPTPPPSMQGAPQNAPQMPPVNPQAMSGALGIGG